MNEKYWNNEVKLRKNITILDDTFSKVGLKVLNVGVEYMDLPVGQYVRFYSRSLLLKIILKKIRNTILRLMYIQKMMN